MAKDPICDMEGAIEAHGYAFCSVSCIRTFEEQEAIPVSERYEEPSRDKTPVIVLVSLIVFGLAFGFVSDAFMAPFMGSLLVIVASLKLVDVRGFAMAFSNYDLLSRFSMRYAFAYPFIEFGLGIAFVLANLLPFLIVPVSILLAVVMLSSLIGVILALRSGRSMRCACLGSVIAVPLSTFTIIEDVGMILMAIMVVV